jgi:hypothetical protein
MDRGCCSGLETRNNGCEVRLASGSLSDDIAREDSLDAVHDPPDPKNGVVLDWLVPADGAGGKEACNEVMTVAWAQCHGGAARQRRAESWRELTW